MFNKKILIFLILLLSIICLSTVSAADNITEDTISLEEVNNESISIEKTEKIGQTENDDVLRYDEYSFSSLKDWIKGTDDFKIGMNLHYVDGDPIDGLEIDKDITIDGMGCTMDAKGMSRIFLIKGGDVVLRNMIFMNAKSDIGGAISGSCTLENCKFINNVATYGGAVYGSCTLKNCEFYNNTATSHGGAVYGAQTLENCNFTGNIASDEGGAIYGGNVKNCNFYNNNASKGGAISNGSIEDSTFKFNHATYGGAILNSYAKNCILADNRADNDGGAAFNGSAEYCDFNSNYAGNNGGGMCNGTAIYSNFVNNVADKYGGAAFNSLLQNCSLENNHEGEGEIVLNSTFSTLQEIIDSADPESTIVLDKNYIYNSGFDKEGILVNKTITIDGNGLTISGEDQGRIFNVQSSGVEFRNIYLIRGHTLNEESHNGGAISGSQVSKAINCTFKNNHAYTFGGASDKIQAYNCTFEYNSAEIDGGALFECDAINCVFVHNFAHYGGAMTNGNSRDCTFIKNTASVMGGGQHNGKAVNCVFIGNEAQASAYTGQGGGFSSGTAVNCTFINNTAKEGDGMYSGYSLLSTFQDNTYLYTTILVPTIEVDSEINANVGDTLFFNLIYDDEQYNGFETKIKVYQDFISVGNYTVLSGDNWIMNLNPGEYEVKLLLEKYPEVKEAKLNLKLVSGTNSITALNIVTVYNSTEDYVITLKTSSGSPIFNQTVLVDFNGAKNYTTDENGQIKISIKGLIPDTYIANITFSGNELYGKASASSKIVINKGHTRLTANDVITFYNIEDYLLINLNNNYGASVKGTTVSVDFNGVKNYTTDENGQIKISTKGLTPETYTVNFSFKENELYFGSNSSSKIIIKKLITTLTTNTVETTYNINGELVITLKDNYGKSVNGALVSVDLNGVKNYTTDKNGQFNISTEGLVPDSYIADVVFNGDELYQQSNTTAKITIAKCVSKLTSNAIVTEYNVAGELLITLKDDLGNPIANAPVSFSLDGINNHITDENGQIIFSTNIGTGWVISFNDGHGYPINGTSVYIDLKTPVNYTTDENGQIKITVKNLNPDVYTADISFEGNDLYLKSNSTTNIVVNKETTVLTVDSITTSYGNDAGLTITLMNSQDTPISDAVIYVDLDGIKNYTTDKKGQINVPISNLAPNNYVTKIKFYENDYYIGASAETAVIIKKSNTKLNVDYLKDGSGLIVTLMDNQSKPISKMSVSVDLDGVKNYTTDSEGQIFIPTHDLISDSYAVKIEFDGNENYTGSELETTVIIKKATKLTADNLIVNYNDNQEFIITLKDSANKAVVNASVSVDLKGINNYTTDKNGQIKIPLFNFTPDKYAVKIKFDGDDSYIGSNLETALIVKKSTTKLTAGTVTAAYNDNKYLVITLKDGADKPIIGASLSVDFKGIKTYTTDKKGQVKISVQNLAPKTYVAKISYAGNQTQNRFDSYGMIVVKKATPKLTLKAKSFKAKTKTKKYSVILKSNKNKAMKKVKVYLKVKGKTYAAKTNSKGQATFKITKLTKKGKHTAVITYKGNAYYNKVAKKVKIKIR